MPRFYVTLTWHDWPEGGSYGDTFQADTPAKAEAACRLAMAYTYITDEVDVPSECAECGCTDMDGTDVCPDCGGTEWIPGQTAAEQIVSAYEDEWHLVDCWDVDQFIKDHAA